MNRPLNVLIFFVNSVLFNEAIETAVSSKFRFATITEFLLKFALPLLLCFRLELMGTLLKKFFDIDKSDTLLIADEKIFWSFSNSLIIFFYEN